MKKPVIIASLTSLRQRLFTCFISVCCLGLTGCVDIDTVVFVRPDGSGTVTETFLFSGVTAKTISDKTADQLTLKPEQITRAIEKFGGQVRLVSNEGIKQEKQMGYRAVYAFEDINQLVLPFGDTANKGDTHDFNVIYRFTLNPDTPKTLRVNASKSLIDDMTKTPTAEEKQRFEEIQKNADLKEMQWQSLQLIKTMVRDMRVAIRLRLENGIAATNAMYHDADTIELLSMRFGPVMASPEFENILALLQQGKMAKPMTQDEAMTLRIPGWQIELKKEIEATFK